MSALLRRRVDWSSLGLLVCGLTCGALAIHLIVNFGLHPLLLVPSVVAATLGGEHLVKHQAAR